ncbi:MAG: glycosyltransferase [Ilumatobacteraceae bacterium]
MTLDALAATGTVDVAACFRSASDAAHVERNRIVHRFEPSDRALVRAVRDLQPDVVHVHGLGFVTLLARLSRSLDRRVAIVVQHHGEPPGPWRNRLLHRLVRRRVSAYLFTGADDGQAEPFRDAGVVGPHAVVFDVLEAASTLPPDDHPDNAADVVSVQLDGRPAVLWVGRLIAGKDPLGAVDAIAAAAGSEPGVHLHMLATDSTMAGITLARAAALGLADRVHLHPPVPRRQMHRWYCAADVLLSTSRREGSNYSLIEALTYGCPPAVTDIAPHRSITGDLAPRFECGDAAGAAAVIAHAAGLERSTVEAYRDAHLTWPVVAGRLTDIYRVVADLDRDASPQIRGERSA